MSLYNTFDLISSLLIIAASDEDMNDDDDSPGDMDGDVRSGVHAWQFVPCTGSICRRLVLCLPRVLPMNDDMMQSGGGARMLTNIYHKFNVYQPLREHPFKQSMVQWWQGGG